jgi:hypothetical protein
MAEHWSVAWNVAGLTIVPNPFGIKAWAVSEEPSRAFSRESTCDFMQDEGISLEDAAREGLFLYFHVCFCGLLCFGEIMVYYPIPCFWPLPIAAITSLGNLLCGLKRLRFDFEREVIGAMSVEFEFHVCFCVCFIVEQECKSALLMVRQSPALELGVHFDLHILQREC